MKDNRPLGKSTRLVFCGPAVDPDLVTKILELEPTYVARHLGNNQKYTSVGKWELRFPVSSPHCETEQEIEEWLLLLRPKAGALMRLVELGYAPYLDCPAPEANLSLYFDPVLLASLGELRVGLSIWLHEPPAECQ